LGPWKFIAIAEDVEGNAVRQEEDAVAVALMSEIQKLHGNSGNSPGVMSIMI
jgi:hypothetical protein